jgi:hypothetical protein
MDFLEVLADYLIALKVKQPALYEFSKAHMGD